MKKGNIVIVNILVLVAAAIFAGVMILGNVGVVKSDVAVIPGSYGARFAEENKLNIVELADTQKQYFDQRYESFDYNTTGSEICIEKYSGKSKELVIPMSIEGKTVTSLGESFIAGLGGVDKIYIPPTLTEIGGDPKETPVICCTDDNRFYINHKDDEDLKWSFELIYDSDFVNYLLGDIPFDYNLKGNSIELTNYRGSDDIMVLPSYIDGYPVTDVPMDLLTTAGITVIPDTVSNISGEVKRYLYTAVFAIELVFTLIAVILSLLTVDVILPRYRKDQREYMLSGSQIVIVLLYVFAQTAFGIFAIKSTDISAMIALIVSLLILLVYVILIFAGNAGRSHAKRVDEKVEQKTERMKRIKQLSKGLADGIKDEELRKKVQRLEDEIRCSDPVSREDLKEIEEGIEAMIIELRKTINQGEPDEITHSVDQIQKELYDRNRKCKGGK
ncbi:MAG: hypothetical protein K5697_03790 [Lachnospiraceae bacterium]|nr:hypothetical protein [Lachnospiraceae bacterium]